MTYSGREVLTDDLALEPLPSTFPEPIFLFLSLAVNSSASFLFCIRRFGACDLAPRRGAGNWGWAVSGGVRGLSGGVAPLNHRLQAQMPPASDQPKATSKDPSGIDETKRCGFGCLRHRFNRGYQIGFFGIAPTTVTPSGAFRHRFRNRL